MLFRLSTLFVLSFAPFGYQIGCKRRNPIIYESTLGRLSYVTPDDRFVPVPGVHSEVLTCYTKKYPDEEQPLRPSNPRSEETWDMDPDEIPIRTKDNIAGKADVKITVKVDKNWWEKGGLEQVSKIDIDPRTIVDTALNKQISSLVRDYNAEELVDGGARLLPALNSEDFLQKVSSDPRMREIFLNVVAIRGENSACSLVTLDEPYGKDYNLAKQQEAGVANEIAKEQREKAQKIRTEAHNVEIAKISAQSKVDQSEAAQNAQMKINDKEHETKKAKESKAAELENYKRMLEKNAEKELNAKDHEMKLEILKQQKELDEQTHAKEMALAEQAKELQKKKLTAKQHEAESMRKIAEDEAFAARVRSEHSQLIEALGGGQHGASLYTDIEKARAEAQKHPNLQAKTEYSMQPGHQMHTLLANAQAEDTGRKM